MVKKVGTSKRPVRAKKAPPGQKKAPTSKRPVDDEKLPVLLDVERYYTWMHFKRALSRLEPRDQRLVELSYSLNLSSQEVGRRLGKTVNAVRVARSRAVLKIMKLMRQELQRSIKELEAVKTPRSSKIERSLATLRSILDRVVKALVKVPKPSK